MESGSLCEQQLHKQAAALVQWLRVISQPELLSVLMDSMWRRSNTGLRFNTLYRHMIIVALTFYVPAINFHS